MKDNIQEAEDSGLFPELSNGGQEEAMALLEKFKIAMAVAAEDVIRDLYCDIACHIESDSWSNFHNSIVQGIENYGNRKILGDYDFKKIRQSILRNHREDIISDLNRDLVEENESLKSQIKREHECRRTHDY